MARETGLEPAASAVTGRRSNQLSYSRNRKRAPLEERAATRRDLRGRPPEVKVGAARRQAPITPAERRLGRVEEVELADRDAIVAQDSEGRGGVEIEVREGEEQEVILALEG